MDTLLRLPNNDLCTPCHNIFFSQQWAYAKAVGKSMDTESSQYSRLNEKCGNQFMDLNAALIFGTTNYPEGILGNRDPGSSAQKAIISMSTGLGFLMVTLLLMAF
jgi:hypothetical protein